MVFAKSRSVSELKLIKRKKKIQKTKTLFESKFQSFDNLNRVNIKPGFEPKMFKNLKM